MKNSSRPLGAFLALVFISLPILAFLSFFIAPETVSKRYGFLFSVLDLVFYLILAFLAFALVAYVLVLIFRQRPFKSASSIRLEFGADSKPDFAVLEIKNLSERDEYIESAGFVEELWRREKVASKTQSRFVTLACPSPSANLNNNFPLKICAKAKPCGVCKVNSFSRSSAAEIVLFSASTAVSVQGRAQTALPNCIAVLMQSEMIFSETKGRAASCMST